MKVYSVYVAEAIATFSLVFIGAGSILAGNDIIGVALAHGLVLMCMVYATAHVSGAHINPAVTVGMLVTKKIGSSKAALYIISQLVGAAVAGFFLAAIFPSAPALNLGTPALASGLPVASGILVEAVLTFFLIFTIFGVAVDKRAPAGFYGLAIGLVLTFDILAGGTLTGAAMNPARAFGPALASGFWENQVVYWIGPIIGAIVAALAYDRVLSSKESQ
ncbi:MAG: aquaporin [Candidatus Aenigmarchaeota archaeon]|nr:aquaporin [Candidatus Aenigmarchaeota archaeon]